MTDATLHPNTPHRLHGALPWLTAMAVFACFSMHLMMAPHSQAWAQDTETKSEIQPEDRLTFEQEQVSAKYRRFEEVILRMAELTAPTDPKRAALLRKTLALSKERQVSGRLDELVEMLKSERFSPAMSSQDSVQQDLGNLLELLLTEQREESLKVEKENIKEQLRKLNEIISEQRHTQSRTAGGEDLQRLAESQKQTAEKTAELAKQMQPKDADKDANKNADDATDTPQSEQDSVEDATPKDDQESDQPAKGDDPKDPKSDDKDGDSKSDAKDSKSADTKNGSKAKKSDASDPADKSGKSGKKSDSSPPSKSSKSKSPQSGEPSDPKSGSPQGSPQDPPPGAQPPQSEESDQSEQSDQESPSNESQPSKAQQKVEAAQKRMEEAKRKLEKAEREGAVEDQEEAIRELEQAKAELEEILRQLREEEMQRTLAMLETRFRKMLELQMQVYDGTKRLDQIQPEKRGRGEEIEAGRLGRKESEIVIEAERALNLLREEGSAVAFPEAVEQLVEDMQQITEKLTAAEVGPMTQAIEEDVISGLEEMIGALEKAQKDLEKQKSQPPGQPMEPGEPPLVDTLAELKMIRSLQVRINQRTQRYTELVDGDLGQAEKPDLLDALQGLADRQQRLFQATRDIVAGRNE